MIEINLGRYIIKIPKKTWPARHDIHDKPYGIREIAQEYYRMGLYNKPECFSIITTLFEIMKETLAKHEKVSIRDFGDFIVGNRQNVSKNITIYFKPSKRLQANFNLTHPKLIEQALRDRKDKTPDFSPENWRESKSRKYTKRKRTTVDEKEVDIFRIVEKIRESLGVKNEKTANSSTTIDSTKRRKQRTMANKDERSLD